MLGFAGQWQLGIGPWDRMYPYAEQVFQPVLVRSAQVPSRSHLARDNLSELEDEW